MQPSLVSLFSGAGGLSHGLCRAGFAPVISADINDDAIETYRINIGDHALKLDLSIESKQLVHSVARHCNHKAPFLLAGGPPCQGFSSAGSRQTDDPRNQLVTSYLGIVEKLLPNWFVFENVEGLLTADGGQPIVALVRRFLQLGYTIRLEKINFASWGLPQARKRVLIIGNRLGLHFEIPLQTHSFDGKKHRSEFGLPGFTVRSALSGLPENTAFTPQEFISYSSETNSSEFADKMRSGLNRSTEPVKTYQRLLGFSVFLPGMTTPSPLFLLNPTFHHQACPGCQAFFAISGASRSLFTVFSDRRFSHTIKSQLTQVRDTGHRWRPERSI